MEHTIKSSDYIIVQRQGYTKLCKIKEKATLMLGQFKVELDNAIGEKYHTTFQMKLKEGSKKLYVLEKVEQLTSVTQLSIEECGQDNRNITDDGCSQTLTKDEIEKMRDESTSSVDIVGKLIDNSKTFSSKTEYSQEKYMKKKEKKYFEYVQIRKPTLRLLAQMFYRQDPAKTLGVRIDDLSQILTYANVQSDGNFFLFDSGTSGLMTAAILNAIGANNKGTLIHAHPGNECQKNAVLALHFPQEQLDRCINVNIYSVLRCFHQEKDRFINKVEINDKVPANVDNVEINKSEDAAKIDEITINGETPAKKRKLNDESVETKRPHWQLENEKACRLLEEKIDGLIITAKEHPVSIVKELVPFLRSSRSLVVFHLLREPLEDLYVYLKSRTDFISVKLSNNFMRNYQVLPDRTHPEVNMTSGGYILSGYKLSY